MKAYGTGGPAVAARVGIELPAPDAQLPRTWVPAAVPVERHSPYCRSRCCGTWRWTLPTPPAAPLAGRGGQAPTLPKPRRPRRTRRTPAEVEAMVPQTSPASLSAAQAGVAVPCTGGCPALVAASYVLATGQDWHGCCPAPTRAVTR